MFYQTITLADGVERKMFVNFGALARIREATGLEFWGEMDHTQILRNLPAIILACLVDREGLTVEQVAELIPMQSAGTLVEKFFEGVAPAASAPVVGEPSARPLVNGHAGPDSTSSGPTQ